MVRQGDIILLNFNPVVGHEQAGYRPALVVSNDSYNRLTHLVAVCPITSTVKRFPMHILLDERPTTQGSILCEHVRVVDIDARPHKVVDHVPEDILASARDLVAAIF